MKNWGRNLEIYVANHVFESEMNKIHLKLLSSQKMLNLLPGATRVCCLATAAAKVERWLRWLTVSLISLLPVVDDPASLDVSLPCRFHNSSASCKISERID